MIRYNIPVRRGRVYDSPLVDSRHHALTRRRAQEVLTFREDGDFEGRQSTVKGPCGGGLCLGADVLGRILEGLEASDEDVREEEEPIGALMVFAEATKNAGGDELTEGGACPIDILAI